MFRFTSGKGYNIKFDSNSLEMKKAPSKSIFLKKNKTIYNVPDSKKSSRIVKANSCIKISSLNSEQNSRQTPIQRQNVSQKQILPYQIPQLSRLVDKPRGYERQSHQKQGKSSIQTVAIHQNKEDAIISRLKERNQQITKQNGLLKQRCCEFQEMSLRDKEKIKNLIIRINEVKHSNSQASQMKQTMAQTCEMKQTQPSNAHLIFNQQQISAGRLFSSKPKIYTPYKAIVPTICENRECLERKKYLESQLYRERILRDKLEVERRQWEANKIELKQQYNELLMEVQEMKENQY